MKKDNKIYKTIIAVSKRDSFAHFLDNLGITNVSFTNRGGYFLATIDLTNVPNISKVRGILNNNQEKFL